MKKNENVSPSGFMNLLGQMAKKKKAKKKKQSEPTATVSRLKYKQITVEFAFTDGGIETVAFYSPADCFRYIERTVTEQYTDSVRVELF